MADIKELRDTPGALYLYSGDFQGTHIVHSAMLVTDVADEPDYIIIASEQGQPRKLSIEGDIDDQDGTYFFESNGKNYALSDFSEAHAEVLFGGLPLTKELGELYVTAGFEVSVGVDGDQPVGVYLTTREGKIYSREENSWVEKDDIPEGQTVVPVGNNQAAMVARALDVGVDITLQEANIELDN